MPGRLRLLLCVPRISSAALTSRVALLAVRAENLVRGPDQQSCLLTRPAVTITGYVPAVRLSPDHAGGLLVAAIAAWGDRENRRDPDPAPPARRPAAAAATPPEPELGGPGPARGPARP